ncbi:unnamed protein product [Urochloa humidicola]
MCDATTSPRSLPAGPATHPSRGKTTPAGCRCPHHLRTGHLALVFEGGRYTPCWPASSLLPFAFSSCPGGLRIPDK